MDTRLSGPTRFADRRFLSLETYRRNGEAVATPLWFVEDDATLYVRTFAGTFKVKRLHHNARVRVVACDRQGTHEGDWIGGVARLLAATDAEARRANGLLNRKYGWQKRLSDLWYARTLGRAVIIAIHLERLGVEAQGETHPDEASRPQAPSVGLA